MGSVSKCCHRMNTVFNTPLFLLLIATVRLSQAIRCYECDNVDQPCLVTSTKQCEATFDRCTTIRTKSYDGGADEFEYVCGRAPAPGASSSHQACAPGVDFCTESCTQDLCNKPTFTKSNAAENVTAAALAATTTAIKPTTTMAPTVKPQPTATTATTQSAITATAATTTTTTAAADVQENSVEVLIKISDEDDDDVSVTGSVTQNGDDDESDESNTFGERATESHGSGASRGASSASLFAVCSTFTVFLLL